MVKSVLSKGNTDFFLEENMMNILETRNLKKYYGKGDTLVKALDGVDLNVEDGEFVAIVGTSGSTARLPVLSLWMERIFSP